MKREYWLIGSIAVLFSAIGIYFSINHYGNPPAPTSAADILFAQSLPDVTGKTQTLQQWKGKILLVNFWATWCPPCIEEMPELTALQTELAGKNVQIIGIGVDSSDNIHQFASKYKITYPLYIAGMGSVELSRQLGNQAGGLPYTLLISPDGQVRKTFLGRLNIAKLRQELATLSQQP